jgi:hypothetical protein
MSSANVKCSDCGLQPSDLPDFIQMSQCPKCGSVNRTILDSETVKAYEKVKVVVKDPQRKSKEKRRREVIAGDDLYKKSGKWNEIVRIWDRDVDQYFKKITDPETGEVIHFCEEPLSQHIGHGSAKKS